MKKKIQKSKIKVFLCLCIILFSANLTGYAQILGDVNNSGDIDIVDALLIAQYYVGLDPVGFISSAADVNCSESIDIVDALLVAQFYVGLVLELSCDDETPAPTDIATPAPTAEPGELHTGNSTYFFSLGSPYGGCGLPQSELDTSAAHF